MNGVSCLDRVPPHTTPLYVEARKKKIFFVFLSIPICFVSLLLKTFDFNRPYDKTDRRSTAIYPSPNPLFQLDMPPTASSYPIFVLPMFLASAPPLVFLNNYYSAPHLGSIFLTAQ
jgi:hypothetical protein